MSLFDLLFIVIFLVTAGTLLRAAFLAVRGRGTQALSLMRRLSIGAGAYLGIVVLTSVFWPRTALRLGERECFDDWCIAVENGTRQPAGARVAYRITLRLSSTARRIWQRENHVAVYLSDDRGHRYDPIPGPPDVPFDVRLGPEESVAATRVFELPSDARDPGVVIAHEGGFPIGWFIIGYESWFHKPAIVRL